MALEPAMILFADNETEEYVWEDVAPTKPAGDGNMKWKYSIISSAVMTIFARLSQISLARWMEGQKKQKQNGVQLATPDFINRLERGG